MQHLGGGLCVAHGDVGFEARKDSVSQAMEEAATEGSKREGNVYGAVVRQGCGAGGSQGDGDAGRVVGTWRLRQGCKGQRLRGCGESAGGRCGCSDERRGRRAEN